jgi:hypothetical protein
LPTVASDSELKNRYRPPTAAASRTYPAVFVRPVDAYSVPRSTGSTVRARSTNTTVKATGSRNVAKGKLPEARESRGPNK